IFKADVKKEEEEVREPVEIDHQEEKEQKETLPAEIASRKIMEQEGNLAAEDKTQEKEQNKDVSSVAAKPLFPSWLIVFILIAVVIVIFFRKPKKNETIKNSDEKVDDKGDEPIISDELKTELDTLKGEELMKRLKQLDGFQQKALEESDEYFRLLLKKIREEINLDISMQLNYDEKRLGFRHEIPSDFPLSYSFTSASLTIKGKVTNIGEKGCGLDITSQTEEGNIRAGLTGELTLNFKENTILIQNLLIIFFDEQRKNCGLSMEPLKRYPDARLLWLETYGNIVQELKRFK
ncbi:MAG: hypothetical protein HQK84_04090, partial [Nitrospinae bacterium]|nr:hypothetical protein [Nitrospinota bacterium]